MEGDKGQDGLDFIADTVALPPRIPPELWVRVRQLQIREIPFRPHQCQCSQSVRFHAANWSALWTLDTGIFNSRPMARRPSPCAFSVLISAARPLMVAEEKSIRRWPDSLEPD